MKHIPSLTIPQVEEAENLMNVIGVYMDISLLEYTGLIGAFFSARIIGKLE